MKQVANYIKSIEIESLWNGKKHVKWELSPTVNILSGINGVGKSTILNRVVMHLLNIDKLDRQADGVKGHIAWTSTLSVPLIALH